MAVEIISRGVNPDMKPIVVDCRSCKTKFSFQRADAIYVHDHRDGDFYKITCPVCGGGVTKQAHT